MMLQTLSSTIQRFSRTLPRTWPGQSKKVSSSMKAKLTSWSKLLPIFEYSMIADGVREEVKPTKGKSSAVKKASRPSLAAAAKKPRARKPLFRLVAEKEKRKGSAKTPIKIDSDDEGSEGGPSSPYLRKSPLLPSRSRLKEGDTPSPEPEEMPEPLPIDRSIYTNAPKDPAVCPGGLSFINEQLS